MLTNSHRWFPPTCQTKFAPLAHKQQRWCVPARTLHEQLHRGTIKCVCHYTKWLTMELGREYRWGWPLKINVMTNEMCKTAQRMIATKLGNKRVFLGCFILYRHTLASRLSILIIICLWNWKSWIKMWSKIWLYVKLGVWVGNAIRMQEPMSNNQHWMNPSAKPFSCLCEIKHTWWEKSDNYNKYSHKFANEARLIVTPMFKTCVLK